MMAPWAYQPLSALFLRQASLARLALDAFLWPADFLSQAFASASSSLSRPFLIPASPVLRMIGKVLRVPLPGSIVQCRQPIRIGSYVTIVPCPVGVKAAERGPNNRGVSSFQGAGEVRLLIQAER